MVLGAVIRFTTIGQQSFWYDEAVTRGIVAHGLGHVLSTVPKTESTPPLYYVLLWLWSRPFGLSEAGLRTLSALVGTLTIPIMWELGRRLVGQRVAFTAALLTAVNPLLFWYSQEARAYALLVFLCAATLLALLHALERPTARRLLVWSVIAAAAVCTHYFAVFVLVPEAVWLGVSLRRRGGLTLRVAAAGLGPVTVVGLALLPLLLHQDDGRASALAATGGSVPHRVVQLVRQDVLGLDQPHKGFAIAAGALLVLFGLALLGTRATRREREASVLPLVIGTAGVALALVVSVLGTDYFGTRNLLPTWPALALIPAIGFGAEHGGRAAVVGLVALSALSLFCIGGVIADVSLQRPDWRGAAHALGPPTGQRAIVSDRLSYTSLLPYLSGMARYPAAGAPVAEIDAIEATASQPGPGFERMAAPAPPPGFRLARRVRTDSYVVVVYKAAAPAHELAADLVPLGPINGEDRVSLEH